MAAVVRLRDVFKKYTPWWLSDRRSQGKTVAHRFLWSMISVLDVILEHLLQGMRAGWPGAGPPEALPWIGRSRGIIRGVDDTHEEYADELRHYLERWERAGSRDALASALHRYLPGRPRVRVVNRAGHWFTVNADGTTSESVQAWDWDSISNPERAGFWSELWVIIYPTTLRPGSLGALTGEDGFAWGHMIAREHVDAALSLLGTWKSAHSKIRAVIWTTDTTKFDPTNPASLPDGRWGNWSSGGSGSRVGSSRDYSTCRFWEPTYA